MIDTLVNYWGRILCFDRGTGQIVQKAPGDVGEETPVLSLAAAQGRGLRFATSGGWSAEIGFPDLTPAPGLGSAAPEVVPIAAGSGIRPGTVAFGVGGRYLRCSPAGGIDAFATAAREWETYRLISAEALVDLAALCRQDWIVAGTRRRIRAAEIGLRGYDALEFGGMKVPLDGLPLAEAERVVEGDPASSPLTGVLFRDDWKHDRIVAFRPLVVFAVFGNGASLLGQFALAVRSLHAFGRYDGDLLVIGDQPRAAIEALVPEELRRGLMTREVRARDRLDVVASRLAVADMPEASGHQPILYCDADVVCDAPVAPILERLAMSGKLSAQVETSTVLGTSPSTGGTLFAEDPMAPREGSGFNAGILGLPGARRGGWALRVARRAMSGFAAARGRDALPWYEQSMLNYSLRRLDLFDPEPISSATQTSGSAGELDAGAPRGFVHFWPSPDRVTEMRRYVDMLSAREAAGEAMRAVRTAGNRQGNGRASASEPATPGSAPAIRRADRPAFSIVVVARNEARTLPHLFNSLWPFRERRGDLLVVDTGSQDETVEMARDFGCRVLSAGDRFASLLSDAQATRIRRRFAREGEGPLATAGQRLFHFSRARQWAAARARHDVVWQLDGSDVVEAFDLDFVDGPIRRGEAVRVGFEIRLGELSFRTCRFSDRRLDRWEGRAHEGLFPKPDATAAAAQRPLLECPPDRLAVRHVRRGQKERNYLAGLALDALSHPERPRWLHYLGREFFYLGFHRSAIAALEAHAAREDAWRPERSSSLCLAGQSRLALGEPAAAAVLFERAHTIDPSWREPLLRLAEVLEARGDAEGALVRATAAQAIPRTTWHVEADQNYTWATHFRIYRSLLRLDRREEARKHWQACVAIAPGLPAFRDDAPAFER